MSSFPPLYSSDGAYAFVLSVPGRRGHAQVERLCFCRRSVELALCAPAGFRAQTVCVCAPSVFRRCRKHDSRARSVKPHVWALIDTDSLLLQCTQFIRALPFNWTVAVPEYSAVEAGSTFGSRTFSG